MSELALIVAASACVLAIGLAWSLWRLMQRLRAERERLVELQQQLELIRQSISGLTAGAVGMDRRMLRLESSARSLSERQETYELQQADEQPYGHAIRLVQQGASSLRLRQELDLSENEAELIVRLHGQRDSA
jgi:predicted  nucleic acid-binding Zn-ribbon protein